MKEFANKSGKIFSSVLMGATLLLSILGLFLINNTKAIALGIAAAALLYVVLHLKALQSRKLISGTACGTFLVLAVIAVLYMIIGTYTLYLITMLGALVLAAVTALVYLIGFMKKPAKNKKAKWITAAALAVLLVIGICGGAFLGAVAIDPNVLIGAMQRSYGAVNSYDAARESTTTDFVNADGVKVGTYTNDIAYTAVLGGKQLENSYLDVYLTNNNPENAPTYFYIHGGGYVWGDKIGGDPNTRDSGLTWYIATFLENGYNVVSPNYVFAPEYLYPTSLLQLNECVKYCMEHEDELGISMDRVVFGGGSAGGNLAGMLSLIYTNEKAANSLGAEQYLPAENVKACVFVSALINNEDFGMAHSSVMDYMFFECGRSAMDCGFLQGNRIARQTNLIAQVDENYCPSYISDGNSGTFYSQAEAFHVRLDELGVTNQLNLYPQSVEVLGHGYESTQNSPCAQENMEKVQMFLRNVLTASN